MTSFHVFDDVRGSLGRCGLFCALKGENLRTPRERIDHVGVLLHHQASLRKVFSLVVGTAHLVSRAVRKLVHRTARLIALRDGAFSRR